MTTFFFHKESTWPLLRKFLPEGAALLDIICEPQKGTVWCAGPDHVIVRQRFLLNDDWNTSDGTLFALPSTSKVVARKVLEDGCGTSIHGRQYQAKFGTADGRLLFLNDGKGTPLISSFSHSFFRAPTDNDRGGQPLSWMQRLFGSLSDRCLRISGEASFASTWKDAGLNDTKEESIACKWNGGSMVRQFASHQQRAAISFLM